MANTDNKLSAAAPSTPANVATEEQRIAAALVAAHRLACEDSHSAFGALAFGVRCQYDRTTKEMRKAYSKVWNAESERLGVGGTLPAPVLAHRRPSDSAE